MYYRFSKEVIYILLVLNKLLALSGLLVSVVNFAYVLDRRVYKVSKAAIYVAVQVLLFGGIEFFKYDVPNILFLERFQDILLLYIPVAILSFSLDLSGIQKSKRMTLPVYSVPTFYLILASTNKFHKLFWVSEIRTEFYGSEKMRPYGGFIPWTYFIFSVVLLALAFIYIVNSRKLDLRTKYLAGLTFAFGTLGSVTAYLLNFNYTFLSFILSHTTMFLDLLAVNYVWRKLLLSARYSAYEHAEEGYIVIDKRSERVIDINEKAAHLLNLDRKAIVGRKDENVQALIERSGEIVFEANKYLKISTIEDEKNGTLLVVVKDVTAEIISKKDIEKVQSHFKTLFENIPDGAVILDEKGKVIECNKQFLSMFGYTKEEVLGKNIGDLIAPDDLKNEPEKLQKLAIEQKASRVETIRKRKDGSLIEVRVTVSTMETGEETFMQAVYTDLKAEREAMNRVRNILQKDTLTGLYTRQYFIRKLSSVIEFSSTNDYNAVIAINIRGFSLFNSTRGHNFGDDLLREISRRLKSVLREGDTIARPYADEFWILLEKVGKDYRQAKVTVANIVGKLESELRKFYNINGEILDIRFSTGIYIFTSMDSPEDVLRKLNLALARAKTSTDGVVYYSALIDNELQELAARERELKEAVYNGELKIFLQPICNSYSEVVGAEALLRWVKKDGSVVPPMDFIRVIEENGMIITVGEEVLRQVCEFILDNDTSIGFIDVNVSPVQLRYPNMADRFIDIISAHKIDPRKIVIEFTENILIEMNQIVKDNIEKLLNFGCQLCIDDFGTGYSSLSYLTLLPLNKIKIDRSFVSRIPEDSRSVKLLEAIFNIARSFNLDAIPEGVENEKQLEVLSMIGYRLFQDYYFGKPMPVEDFAKILRERSKFTKS
ncbi:PAS domain S-box/diguanylate cyclase (GGDEF) domain-containing protein [Fervidobacterium pennivorans DSM 9078]|uniref:PAS domain S-box/diguanylate cyclase (GGDEF) domain-containing protein n=1 Tax=Fervidobacterium pennivorans (strain DSM 9078 / Ven5) TaxID=771875 RepID=H9UAX0_FERPD|nr:PAS domain S-box/diguanylate cyclase (GGDEF) domain-containing protein [Fervidobacterium pennivorans DSM 9078]